ncbi:MAG: peptidase M48 [Methanosphaera sp. rholeuAM270]|nr:MAG: peptidase M48 [Methanosphaera sp. rholeuAM270]
MSKDNRSNVNPFSGKKHFDMVDDDKFLAECYEYYYREVNQYQLLDNTPDGQMVFDITSRLITTVNEYLKRIGRYDYVDGYYDWEVHLVNSDIANACCFPGGKIIVYGGILSLMEYEDELAFVLAHEISHALLDHSRTSASVDKAKNTISTVSWMGSFALDLLGFGGAGELTRAAVNAADMGSNLFLTKPWGRDHELEADKLGLMIAYLAGFNVEIVPTFWQKFSSGNRNEFDFFSTHPSDDKRIMVMKESLYEISNDNNLYSKPLLSKTPNAKKQFKTEEYPDRSAQKDERAPSSYNSGEVITCPNCGNETHVGDNFCIECGFRLNNENKCSGCGEVNDANAKYCIYCGKKL